MMWAVNRYVQRYRLTDRPLASTHLWATLWIWLRRASHYYIIKIIRQLDNSKSPIWLYLFYSLIITSPCRTAEHYSAFDQTHKRAWKRKCRSSQSPITTLADTSTTPRWHWSKKSTASLSSNYSKNQPMAWLVSAEKPQTCSPTTSPTSPSRRATSRDSPYPRRRRKVQQ